MATKEVILKKDVDGLGDEGDIKKVAQGYARNYLLPYGFAVIKNDTNLKKLEAERETIQARKDQKLSESKSIADKIDGLELSFVENTAETGKLFGSIGQTDLQMALKEKGFDIEKKKIHIAETIKNIGEYSAEISFYNNIKAKIKIVVTQKEETE